MRRVAAEDMYRMQPKIGRTGAHGEADEDAVDGADQAAQGVRGARQLEVVRITTLTLSHAPSAASMVEQGDRIARW